VWSSAAQFTASEPFRKIAFSIDSCASTIDEFMLCAYSLAIFLINKEQDTKTVQGLLRHANVSTAPALRPSFFRPSLALRQQMDVWFHIEKGTIARGALSASGEPLPS
jgi:hypothetical protein